MAEMAFLGLDMSKAYVRQPECNGCIERFNRTLGEEVFALNHFKTLEEANDAIRKFVEDYNHQWLIYRLGYKSPIETAVILGRVRGAFHQSSQKL